MSLVVLFHAEPSTSAPAALSANPCARDSLPVSFSAPNDHRPANQVDEADLLLSMVEDPGSFAIIVMKTLRGYFLLLKGKDQEVQESVALPVAKALEADHGVLHFPLCWHL